LRIGAAESFVTIGLFAFLNELTARRLELTTQISVEHSHVLYGRLLERELDIAFLSVRTINPSITLVPLCDVELKWAVPHGSPMLSRYVPKSELLSNRIITMPPVSNIFQYMVDWFEGEVPENLVVCNSLSTNVQMISAGYGVGIVPVCLAERELAQKKIGFLETVEHPLDRLYLGFNNRRHAAALITEASLVALETIAQTRYPGIYQLAR
jgi:DNA-binding transcriptional LysR family regulator